MVQFVQIGGRGGVEVIWTKSKRTATFFRETFPYSEKRKREFIAEEAKNRENGDKKKEKEITQLGQ